MRRRRLGVCIVAGRDPAGRGAALPEFWITLLNYIGLYAWWRWAWCC